VVGSSTYADFTLNMRQANIDTLVKLYVEDQVTVTSS